MRVRPLLCFSLLALACACDSTDPTPDAGASDASTDATIDADAETPSGPDYLSLLTSAAEYTSLSGEGQEVKFLLHADGAEPVIDDECAFQNTARFPYHIQFLRSTFPALSDLDPGTYADLSLIHI